MSGHKTRKKTGSAVTPKIRMLDFSKRLNKACDHAGISPKFQGRQSELSKMFNVSTKASRKWLEAESIPRTTKISSIAKALGVSAEWLLFGNGSMLNDNNFLEYRLCPILSTKEFIGVTSYENMAELITKASDTHDTLPCPAPCGELTFVIQASSGANAPIIQVGECVFVDPDVVPTPGRFLAFRRKNEDGISIRRLHQDGGKKLLEAANPTWPYPTEPLGDDCLVLGTVIRTSKEV